MGYGSRKDRAGTISGLVPRRVHNLKELDALTKTNIAIIARVGAKKKLELLKRAREKMIRIANAKLPGEQERAK